MDEPRPYLAEWWPRVGATLLDGLIVFVRVVCAGRIGDGPSGSDGAGAARFWIGGLLIAAAYIGGTMPRKGKHNGQTLGKQVADIRVVRDDGRPMRFGLSVARDLGLKYLVA